MPSDDDEPRQLVLALPAPRKALLSRVELEARLARGRAANERLFARELRPGPTPGAVAKSIAAMLDTCGRLFADLGEHEPSRAARWANCGAVCEEAAFTLQQAMLHGEDRSVQNAATYVRVSKQDQRTDLQHDETSRLVGARRWTHVHTFSDEGISGSHDRRPQLRAMLEAAKQRRFDVLVVYKTDRMFRSLRELVNVLADLDSYGVGFVSVTEPFDTTTPAGRLLLQLVGAFAEFERSVLIERTRAGIAAARRRGTRIGRPPVELDVARVHELLAAGKSLRAIRTELGGKVSLAKLHQVAQLFRNPPLIHSPQVAGSNDHEAPVFDVPKPFGS